MGKLQAKSRLDENSAVNTNSTKEIALEEANKPLEMKVETLMPPPPPTQMYLSPPRPPVEPRKEETQGEVTMPKSKLKGCDDDSCRPLDIWKSDWIWGCELKNIEKLDDKRPPDGGPTGGGKTMGPFQDHNEYIMTNVDSNYTIINDKIISEPGTAGVEWEDTGHELSLPQSSNKNSSSICPNTSSNLQDSSPPQQPLLKPGHIKVSPSKTLLSPCHHCDRLSNLSYCQNCQEI